MTAVEILQEFLGTLPEGHHDYQGVRRAIEVLRAEGSKNVRIVDTANSPRSRDEIVDRLARITAELESGKATHSRTLVLYNRQQALQWALGAEDDGAFT